MTAVLRRRLQEDVADNWTDEELHELINEAYFWVQQRYYQVNPESVIHIDKTTLEINKSIYPFPRGLLAVKEMGYLDTTDPLGYRDLGPSRPFWINRTAAVNRTVTSELISWSVLGRHFTIFPKPPATIPDAIQLIWTGMLGLANPNDVPEIPFNHMSIVAKAQKMAYAETGDSTKELDSEISDYLSGMHLYMQPQSQLGNQELVVVGISGTTLR